MTDHQNEDDRAALDLLIRGFQVSRMLRLVADIGLADRVPKEGTAELGGLATACAVQPAPLLRVLRALAAFGVFRIGPDGSIAHSARSVLLRTDEPASFHYEAKVLPGPGSWNAWGALDAALVGGIPHQVAWHTGRFQYLREHPDEARDFDGFMANFPDHRHQAIAASHDFSDAALIVDVGGGNGETLRQILARFPKPRGLVFDRDDVVAAIAPQARSGGRIGVLGGSFFDRVPEGADIYLLVRVLHDWSDDDCLRILRNCRAAMAGDARMLIVELILEPDPSVGRPLGYLLDIQMMAMFGSARERTAAEFEALLQACGLALDRIGATGSPVSIIEAVAA